jgi:BioD-like phosphotransacetylase family protein
MGLKQKGINVLGVIPYNPLMALPTIEQVIEEAGYKVLSGKEFVNNIAAHVLVGAMQPCDAMKYITDDCLLITPGDREDMIMAALGCFRDTDKDKLKISGIILTGEDIPDKPIMDLLLKAKIPVLMADTDTYSVASTIHDLTVKIRPRDTGKINMAVNLIKEYVDLKAILKGM